MLHSAAFRRLAAKTQVVGVGVDDFPRTRLTHSLECAQIGREIAVGLGANPDLVDAACLAHDLGHPPFGHNGEAALDQFAGGCGGFEGNAQSFRVLTRLESKVLDASGRSAALNLTRATLDAATKYPWPALERAAPLSSKYGVYPDDRPVFDWVRADAAAGRTCIEAQIMDWADDVAYSVHDLEDGVHAGHVALTQLRDRAVVAELARVAAAHYSDEPVAALADALDGLTEQSWWCGTYTGGRRDQVALKAMTSELIGRLVGAALAATRRRHGPERLTRYDACLEVDPGTRAECAVLKAVTFHYVMSRPSIASEQRREREVIAELAEVLARDAPEGLEPTFAESWLAAADDPARLRAVVDQVASLTDTSARAWHRARVAGGPRLQG